MKLGLITIIVSLVLVGCGENASTSSAGATATTLSGVAATGAPVVNGAVQVKGKSGNTITTTTDSEGKYGADVANLTEPYLIMVTTPLGQKMISVAKGEDLGGSSKVNVTPLTHTIVANVFESKDPVDLFDNFESEANNFSDEKLETQKQGLVKILKDSGIIGASGIVDDDSIDLMKGTFTAGSSQGQDRLLDALDVDLEGDSSKIVIKLKGGTETIEVTPANATKVNIPGSGDFSADITAVESQLDYLGEIKAALNLMAQTYSAIKDCNGAAVTSGACRKDTLHSNLRSTLFHTSYKYDGLTGDEDAWAFFCLDGPNGNDVTTSGACNYIDAASIYMKDVTIVEEIVDNDEYLISFNVYWNGEFDGTAFERVKRDTTSGDHSGLSTGNNWRLYGSRSNYPIYPNSRSVFKTHYDMNNNLAKTDTFSNEIEFYLDDATQAASDNMTNIVLTVPNNSDLQTALENLNGGALNMKLNSQGRLVLTARECINYFTGEEVPLTTLTDTSSCEANANHGINWRAGSLKVDDTVRAAMKAITKFQLSYDNDGSPVTVDEYYYVTKPILLTSSNYTDYVPTMTDPNLCTQARTTFNFTAPTGIYTNYLSANYYDDNNTSHNGGSEFQEGSTSVDLQSSLSSITGSETITSANFWLNAQNANGNTFVRVIDCH